MNRTEQIKAFERKRLTRLVGVFDRATNHEIGRLVMAINGEDAVNYDLAWDGKNLKNSCHFHLAIGGGVMGEFTVRIKTENDCFASSLCGRELVRLLREVASRIECDQETGLIVDINGNRVGSFGFTKRVRR